MELYEYKPSEAPAQEKPAVVETKKKDPNVEERSVNATLAFEKFAGKIFNGSEVLKATTRSEFKHSSNPRFESPLERYNRIKADCAEFEAELRALASDAKDATVGDATQAILKDMAKTTSDIDALINNETIRRLIETPARPAKAAPTDPGLSELLKRLQQVCV